MLKVVEKVPAVENRIKPSNAKMSVTRKEELGIKVNIEYEYFVQLMSTMNDEELSSLLSESQKMGHLHLKKSHQVWKIIPILSGQGYHHSLRFFEGLVQNIEALQIYCFGPEGLCEAIFEKDDDRLQYFLGHIKNPHTVERLHWIGTLCNTSLIPYHCLPENVSCEVGFLEAVESLLVSGLEVDRQQGQELINSICQCWDSYNFHGDSFLIEEMKLDIVKKKMRILRMLLEAGYRSELALHNICEEKYTDLFRMPAEMLSLLLNYEIDIHYKVKGSSAFHKACHRLSLDKIKVLADFGANVNEPENSIRNWTPLEICTRAYREHCLDYFTDDIIRFLHQEKGADIHVICRETGHNLLEIACSCYREEKLAIVLYYLSQKLILKYNVFAHFLLQLYAMDSSDQSISKTNFMSYESKELLSILVMDNVMDTSILLPGPAGRLVVNLFDYWHYDKDRPLHFYMQPDFDMLRMLNCAGFVVSLPAHIEEELIKSTDETKQMTLKILREETSRIPSLAELSRWEVRRVLGPGLISQEKVERLPLPKPMIEYILLLDIIEKKHAQKMYDYFSGRGLNMVCVTKNKKHLFDDEMDIECPECDEDTPEEGWL